MKQLTLFFSSLLFCFALNAQAPAVQWSKCYGTSQKEIFYDIYQTFDDGYICAGHSTGEGDEGPISLFWVAKLSSTGVMEWDVQIDNYEPDYAYSAIQLSDGSYIAVGESHNYTDGYFWGDFMVLKLSSDGEIEWTKKLGGTGWDEAFQILETPEGGYIIAGSVYSDNVLIPGNYGFDDYWVVKMSYEGDVEWHKHYGGSSYDIGRSVALTSDGGYIVVGDSFPMTTMCPAITDKRITGR